MIYNIVHKTDKSLIITLKMEWGSILIKTYETS